jgi:hypothetical protein
MGDGSTQKNKEERQIIKKGGKEARNKEKDKEIVITTEFEARILSTPPPLHRCTL